MAKQQKLIEWTVWCKDGDKVVAARKFQAPVPLRCTFAHRAEHIRAVTDEGYNFHVVRPSSQGIPT